METIDDTLVGIDVMNKIMEYKKQQRLNEQNAQRLEAMINKKHEDEHDEILYAISTQITWAGTMLKNKKWRKLWSMGEIRVLKKIYYDGNYLASEKELLNNILKHYKGE